LPLPAQNGICHQPHDTAQLGTISLPEIFLKPSVVV
jgi:hypothetical protein